MPPYGAFFPLATGHTMIYRRMTLRAEQTMSLDSRLAALHQPLLRYAQLQARRSVSVCLACRNVEVQLDFIRRAMDRLGRDGHSPEDPPPRRGA